MTREPASTKARRLLGEGRVVITVVTATSVRAFVLGDHDRYQVTAIGDLWLCTCPHPGRGCSHIRAVRRVTPALIEER